MKKILLGQLCSYGDCLYATVIARQIKSDFPGCHLTWAISSMCASILDGNPHVDQIWEIPLSNKTDLTEVWKRFETEALELQNLGKFDEVYLTQICSANKHLFDGTVRTSIFRAYPRPITVSVSPVLRLSPKEIENVNLFAQKHSLWKKKHVILFECAPKSEQSLVSPKYAYKVAEIITSYFSDISVILSSNIPLKARKEGIIDGSVLSFRENAELTKHCTLLVGCSSGISWLCTSDWAKPLPMIQIINPFTFSFASFHYDHIYCNLPTDNIIEMENSSEDRLIDCIKTCFTEGFASARSKFNQDISFNYYAFLDILLTFILKFEFLKINSLIKSHLNRHGFNLKFFNIFNPKLIIVIIKKIMHRLKVFISFN